jgi:CheY-like chemotaxis protein
MFTHKHFVLCIDDDEDDRYFLQHAINQIDPSIEVKEADCGEKGLQFLHQLKQEGVLPCLIILDINMPGLNGHETYDLLQKDKDLSSIPLVVFTTSNYKGDTAHWKKKGVKMYTKPMSHHQLVNHVQEIIRHCR